MKVFLQFAENEQGRLVDIATQKSGRGGLSCPFCGVPVLAVKGNKQAHHFRHDGKTCAESQQENAIQGWDKFNFNLTDSNIHEIEKREKFEKKGEMYYCPKLGMKGIMTPEGHGGYKRYGTFTIKHKIFRAKATLNEFKAWFETELTERADTTRKELGYKQYKIEIHRQEAIRGAGLYLFEFKVNREKPFYKIGRTTRTAGARMKEVLKDLEVAGVTVKDSKCLMFVKNAGHVEQYALYKYEAKRKEIGTHREYIKGGAHIDKIIEQMKLLSCTNPKKGLEKHKQAIEKEEVRQEAARAGIKNKIKNGGAFGRPVGQVDDSKFFSKYSAVKFYLIDLGSTIKKTSEATKYSISTVKRVKLRLIKAGMLPDKKNKK